MIDRMENDLASWLEAQIAEDERVAGAASVAGEAWTVVAGGPTGFVTGDVCGVLRTFDHELVGAADSHIAVWDPSRVLAECEAKRRIIEYADEASSLDVAVDQEFATEPRPADDPYIGDRILRALALPYAYRPGYREEWRP